MLRRERISPLGVVVVGLLVLFMGNACSSNSYEGKFVAVLLPEGVSGSMEGAGLIVVDPDDPRKEAEILTEEFASACSPSISHDGRYLYFQGKKQDSGPWQIWMADLHKKSIKQVTDLPENCTHPVSLPDETVVFSRESSVKGIRVNDLWRCGMDGCCLTRLTFDPSNNLYASMLSEGRILFLSSQQVPEPDDPRLMVMRPDGTKSEIYSPGCCGWNPVTGGSESKDGYIYFISSGGRLSRVQHRRPLHTFENLSQGMSGLFNSVTPLAGGGCVVSFKPPEGEHFALYTYDPAAVDNSPPVLLYGGKGDVTDPLQVAAMEVRPRILPSAVNPANPTGLLMSKNINHSMLPVRPGISGDTLANSIRISYLEGDRAIVEAKADGSFYLKLDVEKPFRIETLNSKGETVRGPSDWIYLKPNERRACVGCHVDPELAPENIQPLAVRADPVEVFVKKKETSN